MTPLGRPETLEELNQLAGHAIAQTGAGYQALFDALVSVLLSRGAIDNADLAVKISQIAATIKREQPNCQGKLFDSITQGAMKALALAEYPSLEDAPEWVQGMCRGEGVAKVSKPGEPGSFTGSEGPR